MFFLDLVSNKRVQVAPSMGPGSSQVMPTGFSMTGLKGQERTEGQAGLMFPVPQGAGTHIPSRVLLGYPFRGFHAVLKADIVFLLVRPYPFGPRKWEEPKEPALGPLPLAIGG